MPSLFRRKPSDLATDAVAEVKPSAKGARTAAASRADAKPGATKAPTKSVTRTVTKAPTRAGNASPARAAGASPTRTGGKPATAKATGTKATTLKSSTLGSKPADPDAAKATDDALEATRSRGYTPSKKDLGRATPKRRAGGRAPEPPPGNRREAAKRMRAKQREARAEARAGMLAGKEEYLPKRDQGPERGLVRDIVDARHSVTRWFMPAALVLVLLQSALIPLQFQAWVSIAFYLMILTVFVDSYFLTRTLKRELTARFPKAALPARSHYFYAIMRALSIRRFRMPGPRVKVGEKV